MAERRLTQILTHCTLHHGENPLPDLPPRGQERIRFRDIKLTIHYSSHPAPCTLHPASCTRSHPPAPFKGGIEIMHHPDLQDLQDLHDLPFLPPKTSPYPLQRGNQKTSLLPAPSHSPLASSVNIPVRQRYKK